jgi:hypothetical protein
MTKIHSYSEPDALADAAAKLVQLTRADGADPSDLSAADCRGYRYRPAVRPHPGVGFAVVMRAASDVAVEWVTAAAPDGDERDALAAPIGTTIHCGGDQ